MDINITSNIETIAASAITAPAISLSGITKAFGAKTVLDNINLQIAKGEIFGLLGPSGAGKTTLIKLLTGQLKPSSGTARLFGKDTSALAGADYNQIGIMMDSFGLYERLSCYDNLKFFAQIYDVPYSKIDAVLEDVGLSEARKTTALNLSKGMRSRLLLARVLLREPNLLFLDEPTGGLDPATTREIHKLIYKQRDKGVTIFLTTHNMAEAEKMCDHIALLNDGHIVEYGMVRILPCPKTGIPDRQLPNILKMKPLKPSAPQSPIWRRCSWN